MFNPIIETAIGLVFVYLLLSMICSALQEWIAALFALRASTLFEGITKMLCGDDNLRDQIFSHPLVDGLSRKSFWDSVFRRPARPSYISSETFAKALVAEANITNETMTPPAPGAAVPAAPTIARNGKPLHSNTQQLLQTLLEVAPGDVNVLRKNVEDWYNDAMDRVSGWYKRKTQLTIIILGFLLAAVFNADTVMLARAFWNDPILRANTANAAAQWINTHEPPGASSSSSNRQSASTAATQPNPSGGSRSQSSSGAKSAKEIDIANLYPSVTSGESEPAPPAEQPYSAQQQERAEQEYRNARTKLKNTTEEVTSELKQIRVPLGWCTGDGSASSALVSANTLCDADHRFPPGDASTVLLKLCGLLITMVALSQGAPFWFDLLKKVVNLRLAGDAPDEKKK
ncbi:MAG TPA: hypothetical protein VK639_12900 [Terriglobales bacterium]|nr:hypothetical protein [Terriglobales bacterium]